MRNRALGALKVILLVIAAALMLSGCVSIPIPSEIPIPNSIPILSWFLG